MKGALSAENIRAENFIIENVHICSLTKQKLPLGEGKEIAVNFKKAIIQQMLSITEHSWPLHSAMAQLRRFPKNFFIDQVRGGGQFLDALLKHAGKGGLGIVTGNKLARRKYNDILPAIRSFEPEEGLTASPSDLIILSAQIATAYHSEGKLPLQNSFPSSFEDLKVVIENTDRWYAGCGDRWIEGVQNFAHAKANRVTLDPDCWPQAGELYLHGFEYESLLTVGEEQLKSSFFSRPKNTHVRWLSLSDPQTPMVLLILHRFTSFFSSRSIKLFNLQPYRQAAKALSQAGDVESARLVAIKMYDNHRAWGGVSIFLWPFHYLFGLFAGYGYRPRRSLVWIFGFFLIGWLIADIAWRDGAIVPAKEIILTSSEWQACVPEPNPTECWLEKKPGKAHEPFDALIYSIDVFLPIVSLEQEEHWTPAVRFGSRVEDYQPPSSGETWTSVIRLWSHSVFKWVMDGSGLTSGRIAWFYRIFHESFGYLLSAFALAALTRLTNRDV